MGFAYFALVFPVSGGNASPAPDTEAAAIAELTARCEEFLLKYPKSEYVEEVAVLAGEVLVKQGKWKEVGPYYRELEKKFPQSGNLDRFVVFQGLAFFQEADFKQATPLFERLLKDFPKSALVENASYYLAMTNFLRDDYQKALAAVAEHLKKFPDGRLAGDMIYRNAFILFNDKQVDQSDKIIRDLSAFLAKNPADPVSGSMLCLLADTYKRKADSEKANEDKAIETYIKAVWTNSPDDVIEYGLDSATNLLKARKDWGAVAGLHGEFLKRKPDSQLALLSVAEMAKSKARDGMFRETSEMIAAALKPRIADSSEEKVEFLIDELVKTLVPRKKLKDLDADALDKQLVEILSKIIAGQENRTTAARVDYARARLAQQLKRPDRSDLLLKGIAIGHAKDPSALSPVLLKVCGAILLKMGDIDGAEAMFKRLREHFPNAMK